MSLAAVIGRGGLIKPIPAGVYEVNDAMRRDLQHATMEHASNLGGLLADGIAATAGIKAYIADPVVVDEMDDIARLSGHPDCPRRSIFHALNQKATARLHCDRIGIVYEKANLVVAHLGGGISVAAHKQGRVVDVNNALDGDGPFAPEPFPPANWSISAFRAATRGTTSSRCWPAKAVSWRIWGPTP